MQTNKNTGVSLITFLTITICLTFLINSAFNHFAVTPEPFVKYESVTNETLLSQVNNGEVIKVVIDGSTAYYKTEAGHYKVLEYNEELTPLLELNELAEIEQVVSTSNGMSPLTVVLLVLGAFGLVTAIIMAGLGKMTDSAMKNIDMMQQKERGGNNNGNVVAEKPKEPFSAY